MQKENTYGYIIFCDNCGLEDRVDIPKGTSVEQFTTELAKECPRCGFEDCWKGKDAQ